MARKAIDRASCPLLIVDSHAQDRLVALLASSMANVFSTGRYGYHEKVRMVARGEQHVQPPLQRSVPRAMKKMKSAATAAAASSNSVAAAADDSFTFASCFNILAALLEPPVQSAPSTTELHAALCDFETQRPSWAAVAFDLVDFSSVVQNAVGLLHRSTRAHVARARTAAQTSLGLCGVLASAADLVGILPASHHLTMLRQVAYCVHVAPNALIEFAGALDNVDGLQMEVRIVLKFDKALGALLVAAQPRPSGAQTAV